MKNLLCVGAILWYDDVRSSKREVEVKDAVVVNGSLKTCHTPLLHHLQLAKGCCLKSEKHC